MLEEDRLRKPQVQFHTASQGTGGPVYILIVDGNSFGSSVC